MGYRTGRRSIEADRTTPEAPLIQELLAEMVADGTRAAAMEVSSHSLALDRVEGCRFDVAVFTNLTRDHLDFHGDMESYYQAKKRLFALRKPGACAVINVDDPSGPRLLAEVAPPVASFSPSGAAAEFRAENGRCDLSGVAFELAYPGGRLPIASPLLGRFQLSNLAGPRRRASASASRPRTSPPRSRRSTTSPGASSASRRARRTRSSSTTRTPPTRSSGCCRPCAS